MARHWISSAVRITSPEGSADEISAALGMEPTRSYERGTLASPRNPKSGRRDRLVWLIESNVPEEARLEDHLRWAADLGEEIRARERALPEDWRGDIVIGWTPEESQESVALDQELIAALSRTSFDIHLTAYAIADADSEREAGVKR